MVWASHRLTGQSRSVKSRNGTHCSSHGILGILLPCREGSRTFRFHFEHFSSVLRHYPRNLILHKLFPPVLILANAVQASAKRQVCLVGDPA